MSATADPTADHEPFSTDGTVSDGRRIGVVVSHGFTGTPASMRPWAQHLADAGYSVRLPLLPGHGRTWQDTNRTRWPQWYGAIEDAYLDLARTCDTVVACGLSMGGTLVTRLAEQHPDGVAGLVLVNPAYGTQRFDAKFAPYIAWAVRSRPAIGGDIKKPGVVEAAADRTPVIAFASLAKLWKRTVADLSTVTAPVLLYRSREDHVVDPLSAQLLKRHATNTTIREVVLENSYHVATLDNDAPLIFEGSVEFIRALSDPVTKVSS
ncbi:alpha/beta hydrolase [uncultured Jatrophihabitans sp.]|uniref:alpha/beta hydrolase n=1 Tax=uncultured Jatrophihabitans sp. TaxID=1610747 RepID=UPI0035CB1AC5